MVMDRKGKRESNCFIGEYKLQGGGFQISHNLNGNTKDATDKSKNLWYNIINNLNRVFQDDKSFIDQIIF